MTTSVVVRKLMAVSFPLGALGLVLAVATMAVSLGVNWVCFPTFEFGFNGVLIGLTAFGLGVFAVAPWLWRSLETPRAERCQNER